MKLNGLKSPLLTGLVAISFFLGSSIYFNEIARANILHTVNEVVHGVHAAHSTYESYKRGTLFQDFLKGLAGIAIGYSLVAFFSSLPCKRKPRNK